MLLFRLSALAGSLAVCAALVWGAAQMRIKANAQQDPEPPVIIARDVPTPEMVVPEEVKPQPELRKRTPPPIRVNTPETEVPVDFDVDLAPIGPPTIIDTFEPGLNGPVEIADDGEGSGTSGAATVATPTARRVLTSARWLKRPDGSDFAREYPERPARRGEGGRVRLDCKVRANGTIDCNVLTEDPPGMGFGEAAKKIAKSFQMAPALEDGTPVDGYSIIVPITFVPPKE